MPKPRAKTDDPQHKTQSINKNIENDYTQFLRNITFKPKTITYLH